MLTCKLKSRNARAPASRPASQAPTLPLLFPCLVPCPPSRPPPFPQLPAVQPGGARGPQQRGREPCVATAAGTWMVGDRCLAGKRRGAQRLESRSGRACCTLLTLQDNFAEWLKSQR